MEPYGLSIFCEDIRNEVGGQRSLIGVLAGHIYLPTFPFVIPKLGVITYLALPPDMRFDHLVWKIYFPGDPADSPGFNVDISVEGQIDVSPQHWADADIGRSQNLTQQIMFSPVQIKEPGAIKVRVEIGDVLIKAGVLVVNQGTPSTDPNPQFAA